MSWFIPIGALGLVAGVAMIVTAIRGPVGEQPKSAALLIAGTMVAALGLIIAGFAIVYLSAPEPAR
jgi:hypothetical protein